MQPQNVAVKMPRVPFPSSCVDKLYSRGYLVFHDFFQEKKIDQHWRENKISLEDREGSSDRSLN